MPYAYIQYDSADYLATAHEALANQHFSVDDRRTYLTPLLFLAPFALPWPALISIAAHPTFVGLDRNAVGWWLGALLVQVLEGGDHSDHGAFRCESRGRLVRGILCWAKRLTCSSRCSWCLPGRCSLGGRVGGRSAGLSLASCWCSARGSKPRHSSFLPCPGGLRFWKQWQRVAISVGILLMVFAAASFLGGDRKAAISLMRASSNSHRITPRPSRTSIRC